MDIGNSDAISRASSSTVDGKASEAVAMLGQNPNCDPNGLDSCCPQDAPIIQEFSRNVDRFFDKHNLNNNPDIAHPEHLAAAMANTVLVRLRRRDDQTTLADDQAHPFQQGNPKSHPGDGSGGDDAGNPANSKKRRIGRDPDIPLGIKIALSKDCTSDLLEEIRAAAAVSLSDTKITIRDRNRNIQKVLVTPSARESTDTFFGPDMLGGLFRRLNNIIREADDYNTEMLGGHCDICDDLKELLSRYHLPSEIEMVCRSLAHLNVASAHQPELDSLGSVLYIMHLVRLNNAWAEGLQSLSRGNTAWLERINMLPQRGTNSSQLKEKICGMMDTKPYVWDSFMQASLVPTAMVDVFGLGSILFLKGSTTENLTSFPSLSSATRCFEAIKQADTNNHIFNAACHLGLAIVDSFWDEDPFMRDSSPHMDEVSAHEDLKTALDRLIKCQDGSPCSSPGCC